MDNRIRELRLARKWSQDHLASLTGVTRRQVQYWEAGTHDPQLKTAFELADLFGVAVDDLYPKALRKT